MEISEARRTCRREKGEEGEDMISELPQDLQYEIISLLPIVEIVRTSVLSKTWLQVWSTYPCIELHHSFFCHIFLPHKFLFGITDYFPTEDETRKFEAHVNRTLTRYQQQKIDVERILLVVKIIDSRFASLVEDWIRIAIDMDTSPHLDIAMDFSFPTSPLLVQLLLGSQKLRALSITGSEYKLSKNQPSLLSTVTTINCKSLVTLKLCNVVLKESEIEYLLSCCPCIKKLCLRFCVGFKKIRVANLNHLKAFTIEMDRKEVVTVDIEAPSLRGFKYLGNLWKLMRNRPGVVNIKPTQNLKYLSLRATVITDTDFKNLFSNFPHLEKLTVENPRGLGRIDISSLSLKKLQITLDESHGQVEGNIDAPYLDSICYSGCIPSFTFSKHTNQVRKHYGIKPPRDFDTSFLFDLRDFALKQKLSVVTVLLGEENSGYIDLEELSGAAAGVSPLQVVQLHLSPTILMSDYRVLIEGLLWMCRPKCFTVYRSEDEEDHSESFLPEILREYRENHVDCCISDQVKCWRHYFSELEIESFEKDEEKIHSCKIRTWKFQLRSRSSSSSGSN